MSEDLISREKAYKVLTEYYHHKTEMQHKALREALNMVPSADIDLSDYSDRLWRNAYEQGKAVSKDALDEAYAHGYTAAEADFHKKNQWIPVTERLPNDNSVVVVCGEKGTWDFGTYRGHMPSHINFWNWKKNTVKEVHWWMYKKDALPEPWKGGAE